MGSGGDLMRPHEASANVRNYRAVPAINPAAVSHAPGAIPSASVPISRQNDAALLHDTADRFRMQAFVEPAFPEIAPRQKPASYSRIL